MTRALAEGRTTMAVDDEPGREEDLFSLVVRLRRGERSALAEVYDRHHESVRRFSRRLVGDTPSAEDLVHDTFLVGRRKEVRDALDELPPDQRQVVELAYFGGRTQVAIAEELGIPVGTVKTRTFAAMRKLRAALRHDSEVTDG